MGSLRTRHFKWTPIFILYQIAGYVNKLNIPGMPRFSSEFALVFSWLEQEIEVCIIPLAGITGGWPVILKHWIPSTDWEHLLYSRATSLALFFLFYQGLRWKI